MANTTDSGYNTAPNATASTPKTIQVLLITGKVWNAILIAITLWILISMIIFGSVQKRWKKSSGSSSLNSGVVYISCVIVGFATMVRLIYSAVLFYLPKIKDPENYCETVMDIDKVTTCIVLCMIYVFLWLRQKLIYEHPSVKTLAGKFVKATSWLSLFFLAVIFILLSLYFIVPDNTYIARSYGCVARSLNEEAFPSIQLTRAAGFYLLATGFLLTQVILLGLFIYPVVRNDVVLGKARTQNIESVGSSNRTSVGVFTTCWRVIAGNPVRETSPVTIIIRRSMIACMVTCVANLTTTILSGLAAHHVTQAIVDPGVNTGYTVALICCVTSLGNIREILTILCMKCGQFSGKIKKGISNIQI